MSIKPTLFIPTERELSSIFLVNETYHNGILLMSKYKDFDVVITGIGKANAAIASAIYFSQNPSKVGLLVGICGAYRGFSVSVGEVYSIKYDYFADEACYEAPDKLTSLSEKGMGVCCDNRAEFKTIKGFAEASSNTISFIAYDDKISSLYQSKTGATLENMEGAAFGLAANRLGAEVYQMRAVSNFCGEKSGQAWDIKLAAKNLKAAADFILHENLLQQ